MAQLLTIVPDSHLTFKGPFNEVVTSILTLTNITSDKVCFKVKTTAPRRYCVRPNSGVINAGDTMEVSIMLQPFQYDPNERNNHKFMVQSMALTEENATLPLEEIWKNAEPRSVVDKKLKCQFEMPLDAEESGETSAATQPSPSPSVSPATATPPQIDQTFVTSPSGGSTTPSELQKATERMELLLKENANLKKRVAEAASRPASPADQYQCAAYYVIFVILGWLMAKFVV